MDIPFATGFDFVFEQVATGGNRNFGYLLGDRKARVAALVDPSFRPELLLQRAQAQGLEVRLIINTHGHTDHTNGNPAAKKKTGAKVAAWKTCPVSPDIPLEDGDELELGSLRLRALHVPGHTPDHIVVYLAEERVALTGDHLFVGKIGGTGTEEDARTQYESLQRLLRDLPEETTIWPGHDVGCRPASTLAIEKRTNPFLLAEDFAAFLRLKAEWPEFKKRYGLV